jgi:small subunit ribosomal protein S2
LINLRWPVGAVVVVDAKKEATAIKEAVVMGVPVIALVDTNSSPEGISIVIPANDDIERSISLIVAELAEAVARGKERAKEDRSEEVVAVDSSVLSVEEEEDSESGVRRAAGARARKAPGTRRVSSGEQEKVERKAVVAPKKSAVQKASSPQRPAGSARPKSAQKKEEGTVAEAVVAESAE